MKALAGTLELDEQIADLERRIEELRAEIYSKLTRWQRVQIARHPERPYTLDYLAHSFDEFIELHGDRCFRDDPAIVGGLPALGSSPLLPSVTRKGETQNRTFTATLECPIQKATAKLHDCSDWRKNSGARS